MYIEYMTPQRIADPNYTEYNTKGGEYRPTWLIRTSDWEKVPGHEATDGYHTLSYVWEQSGETIQFPDGEHICVDDGHHRIVKTKKEERRISNLLRHRQQVPVTYEVTYDKLLQQICKDFDIEYLWYDKMCIDQTNKAEKQREIKQMHLIYSNARYTVALVPEIDVDNPEDFEHIDWVTGHTEAKVQALGQMLNSLWWKRSWTLEEVMMSTRILIVGKNTHFWSLAKFRQSDKVKESEFLATIMLGFKERKVKSANQVLKYAHFRTSTKQHDKIYALANIFADQVPIHTDYGIDASDAMNTFYRHLAEKDLSVICFGSILDENGEPEYATTMDSYNLPSWTGVAGLHSGVPIADITLDQNCEYNIDDNMRLRIQCRSYTIRPTKYNNYDVFEDDERTKKAEANFWRVIASMDDFGGEEIEALDWSIWCMKKATACNLTHYHKPDKHLPLLSPILPLSLTEECDECIILGVIFDSVTRVTKDDVFVGYIHDYLSPVARKSPDGSSYRIIGVVLLKHFRFDKPLYSPQEVMDEMLDGLGCETRNFCIE